jgi:hypothetical protein
MPDLLKEKVTKSMNIATQNPSPGLVDTASVPAAPLVRSEFVYILLLVVASLLLALPFLLYGPLPNAHDGAEHLNFTRFFSEQFWSGDLYPRWLRDMNHGLGSPSYFVYPPLPAYVCVAIEPICRLLHLNAFNIAAWLSLLCSGLCAFLWLRTFAVKRTAFVCSVLYMAMPYHLAIDLYRRSALSECWAFAWMPLLLYFAARITAGKRRSYYGFAITFALLIFSHLISVAMFFWIPVVWAVLVSRPGMKIVVALRLGLAMVLGSALSAVYLLPALSNAKYMPASRFMFNNEGYRLSNQLVFLGKGLFAHFTHENFLQTISLTVAGMLVLCIAAGVVAALPRSGKPNVQVYFWSSVGCFSVAMMCKGSAAIWQHIPSLHEAIQYPWRFNAVLCIAVTALLALGLTSLSARTVRLKAAIAGVVIIIAGISLLVCGNILRFYALEKHNLVTDQTQLVNEHDGWFHAWVTPGTNQQAALAATEGPQVYVAEGTGYVRLTNWQPRLIDFDSNMPTGGWVRVSQFFYPTWQARAAGTALSIRPILPEGLLEVEVPAGSHHVQVEIPASRSEIAGRILSLLALLVCIPLAVIKPHQRRNKQANILPSRSPSEKLGQPLLLVAGMVFVPWLMCVLLFANIFSALVFVCYALLALAIGATIVSLLLRFESRMEHLFLAPALGITAMSSVGALWLRAGLPLRMVFALWVLLAIPGAVVLWSNRVGLKASRQRYGIALPVLSLLVALIYYLPAARNDAVMQQDGSFQWMYVDTQHFYAITADLKNSDGVPKSPGTTVAYLRYHFAPYVPAAVISRITGLSVGDSLVRVTRATSLWSLVIAVFALGSMLSLKATGRTSGGILCVAGFFFYGALLALFTNEVNSASPVSGAVLFVIPNINVLADGGPFSHLVLGHSMLHGMIAIASIVGVCLAGISDLRLHNFRLLVFALLPALAVPMNSVAGLYCLVALATLLIWSRPKEFQTWIAAAVMLFAFLGSWFSMGFHQSSDAAGVAIKHDFSGQWWTLLITFAVGLGIRAIGFQWVSWPIRNPMSALVVTSTLSLLGFSLLLHLGDDNERYGIYFLQCLFSIFAFSRIGPSIIHDGVKRDEIAASWLSITAKGLIVLFALGTLTGIVARLRHTHTDIPFLWPMLGASLFIAVVFALLARLIKSDNAFGEHASIGVFGLLALGFLAWIPPVMNFGLDRMKMYFELSSGEVQGLTRLRTLALPNQVFATNHHSVPSLAARPQRSYGYTALSEHPVLLEGYLDRGISSLPTFPDLLRNNDRIFTTSDPQTVRTITSTYNVKWLVAEPGTDIMLARPLPAWLVPQQDTGDLKIYRVD